MVSQGNPPYLEYSKVKNKYSLLSEYLPYSTNLYSACCFRANKIKRDVGYASFIVPVSLPSTDRMEALRLELSKAHKIYHVSFSTRPGKLFEGAEQRLTIYIQVPTDVDVEPFIMFSGGYLKWSIASRASLFACIEYVNTFPIKERHNIWPKLQGGFQKSIFNKIISTKESLKGLTKSSGAVI